MNLTEILSEQARLRPQAAAIIETHGGGDRVTTFGELQERAGRVATLLQASGVAAGDPVLILQPMSTALYEVLLGVFHLGAVAMFLDPSAGREHIEQCCALQSPRALIASPKAHLLRLISGALRRIPLKLVIGPWLPGAIPMRRANACVPRTQREPCAAETPALLTFTSGSTGQPKAAVRTHGFLLAQHRVLARHLRLEPGEVDLTTLPVFLLANLASGVTSVIPDADLRRPGFIRPEPVLAQIARLGVTRSAASPAFFEQLLRGADASSSALRGLRKIFTGGAPVFLGLLQRLQHAAPEAKVEAVYGSTEAEPIAHLDAGEISGEDRSAMCRGGGLPAGQPIPEIRLQVIRDQWGAKLGTLSASEFAALSLPAGEIGEIVVTGEHVLRGYLAGRGDEETKFSVNGIVWHRTGDAGKLDARGQLWLLGRCGARVDDAHGRLYPFAVECVAQEHPGIVRAAFVRHQNQRCLVVEATGHYCAREARALREELAWAAIENVVNVKRLPVDRRHNAKIDYPALVRLLGG